MLFKLARQLRQSGQHSDTALCIFVLTRTEHVGFQSCFLSANYRYFFIRLLLSDFLWCAVCLLHCLCVFLHPSTCRIKQHVAFPCFWRIVPARVLCAHPLQAREATWQLVQWGNVHQRQHDRTISTESCTKSNMAGCSVRIHTPKVTWLLSL